MHKSDIYMKDPVNFENERLKMVSDQIISRGIHDKRLLAVLREVPRHKFVPPAYQHLAYTDGPLPIGEGQTISQPYIVALMTDLLRLNGDENILEIGTGSGYQAAILAGMAANVYSIERHASLADRARKTLDELGFKNVVVLTGDGTVGLEKYAPFEGVLVTAAAPQVPQPLFDQLADKGRMIVPVGGVLGQYLQVWIRHGNRYDSEVIAPVAFVPLRGKHGWSNGEWSNN